MRAWLLVRLGGHWRTAVTSVIIDRGIGLALLIALGFAILLLPSDLTGFEGYRHVVRGAFGMMTLAGVLGFLLAPKIAVPLARWRYSRWLVNRLMILSAKAPRSPRQSSAILPSIVSYAPW